MNKQCKACGAEVPIDANFCQVCGGADLIVNNSEQPEYNQNPYNYQAPVAQTWQPPVTQEQPKKKKTGLVVGIIIAALILLSAIGTIAEKVFQEQGYGDYNYSSGDDQNNVDEDGDEELYYSKGTFDGSVYTNEWADIKFTMPEGYSDADSATYMAAENSNTECGMYFMADDTSGLIYICYEKLPTLPVYDEEKYLDSAMKSLQNISGVTYTLPDTYTTATIGGYTYAKAECEFNNGYGDFINTFYVRKLDKYMIVISAIGVNAEYNDALVSNITTAE